MTFHEYKCQIWHFRIGQHESANILTILIGSGRIRICFCVVTFTTRCENRSNGDFFHFNQNKCSVSVRKWQELYFIWIYFHYYETGVVWPVISHFLTWNRHWFLIGIYCIELCGCCCCSGFCNCCAAIKFGDGFCWLSSALTRRAICDLVCLRKWSFR